jgi:hypothetical protein
MLQVMNKKLFFLSFYIKNNLNDNVENISAIMMLFPHQKALIQKPVHEMQEQ